MFTFADVLRTPQAGPGHHVVLGTRLDGAVEEHEEEIFFAAGCFWGVEKIFWSEPGVTCTATGYMGGHIENPTYPLVCEKTTGHAETVRVRFDTRQTSAAQLIATFFEIHDPTQGERQGNDIGPQYRSAIWTTTPSQYEAAVATRAAYQGQLDAQGFASITTTVEDRADHVFWYAEDYHQGYLFKNPDGYQCHSRTGVACPVVS